MQPFDFQNKAIQKFTLECTEIWLLYNILIDLSFQSVCELNLCIHGLNLELNATFPSKDCDLHP